MLNETFSVIFKHRAESAIHAYLQTSSNVLILQIRRQGRDHNGRSISFNKPLTVRNPFEFQAGRQNLPQRVRDDKIQKFPDMAPVFDMKAMLKAEAEKLRQKVEEASLMAAQAAEEAEEKVKMIAEEAMKITGAEKVEVDEIVRIFRILIHFWI